MSFILEEVKNGKDIILYNNFKYRETYSIKSGDIVWKCLGKLCKASIKTNKEKTIIHASSNTHSGQHPVTMRALTPTTCCTTPMTPKSDLELSKLSEPRNTTELQQVNPDTPVGVKYGDSLLIQELGLRDENEALRDELARLREEKNVILNHSIESDLRLLKYTEDIFSSPQSVPLRNTSSDPPPTSTQSTQTDVLPASSFNNTDALQELTDSNERLKTKLKNAEEKIKNLETIVKSLHGPCKECQILKEESRNMITSIRCLESEINSLRRPTNIQPSRESLLAHQNRFDILAGADEGSDEHDSTAFTTVVKRQKTVTKSRKKKIKISNNETGSKNKTTVPFKNVTIVGDSHVRHMSALLKDLVQPTAVVSGMCKPSAGLLNIAPLSTPPPSHCYVLMGGTNDVAAGREINIFSHLETIVQNCLLASKLLLVPLPPRHDLPRDSPIHRSVQVVNQFMKDLCSRYDGVDMLDISAITRQHYTSHGLHMRASGKKLLAKLMVKKLALHMRPCKPALKNPASIPPSTEAPQMSTWNYNPHSTVVSRTPPFLNHYSVTPFTLPHDTFADAVKKGPSPEIRTFRRHAFLGRSRQYLFQE